MDITGCAAGSCAREGTHPAGEGGGRRARCRHTAYLPLRLWQAYGYSPEKSDYRIKGKTFSGYHILAYYYVSWALSLPDMLEELQLPYSREYELALRMYRG